MKQNRHPGPGIRTLCVFTHERPAKLKACLDSYLAHFRKFGRSIRVVVYDDSTDLTTRGLNKKVVAGCCDAYGVEGLYRDAAWKRRCFAAMLPRLRADEKEAAEFLLFGKGPWSIPSGANFNWALLAHAGEQLLLSDDDLVCEASWSPYRSGGLRFSGEYDPTEFMFFRDRSETLRSEASPEIDILAEHEALLGKDLRALADVFGPAVTGFDEFQARAVGSGMQDVGLVMGGITGDSGLDSPLFLLTLDGVSRDSLLGVLKDRKTSVAHLREIHRCVRSHTVTDGSFLMTNTFSIDNGQMPPPFFPVERGVDATFAWAFRKVLGDRLIAYLPIALRHVPDPKPAYHFDDISMKRLDLCAIMLDRIASCKTVPGSHSGNLGILGDHFVAFAAMPPAGIHEHLAGMNRRFCEANIADLEEYLEKYDRRPREWAQPLEEAMSDLRSTLHGSGFPTFNFLQRLETAAVVDCISTAFRLFGQGLHVWPALTRAYCDPGPT